MWGLVEEEGADRRSAARPGNKVVARGAVAALVWNGFLTRGIFQLGQSRSRCLPRVDQVAVADRKGPARLG